MGGMGGGPSVGGRAGWSVMGGGGSSTIGGGGDSSVAGGAASSVVGGGSSAAGRGSSTRGVEGSSTAGGSPAAGEGASVAGGGGGAGSLVVGAGSSSAGGTVSPILPGKLLVLIGGEASRDEGSRVACGANDSFVAVGEEEEGPSCAAGGALLGVTRTAAGTGAGPALADRSVAIWRSLSPAHGILVPAAATSSLTLRSTLSPSVPSTAVTCSSTCSSTPPATRSITSSGESMGLSESGASQLSSETNTTAAATTPVPASTYPRLARPRRRTKRLARANRRRAGARKPRPPPPSLRTGCFSICLSIRGTPLPLTAVVSGRVLVDLLVTRGGVARAHVNGRAYVLEFEVVCLGAALNDAYLVLGVSGVGHPLDACALVGVVARV